MLMYQHIPIRDAGRLRAQTRVPSTRSAGRPLIEPRRRTPASGTTSVDAVLDGTSGDALTAMRWQRPKQPV
jgi:hypothetical protein